ncbi:MAG TPA: hypothetical protein VHT96_06835 [Clostridia bacterium]|nr:hypothetical protein [Clostridia bacterium]
MVDQEYKKAEYNAFGPWIIEITDQYPLPPLFIPYYKEDGIDLMRIKIPRNIERRNANPDMDLYDYVIGLYENNIYILERLENDVKETKILYDEIEGLENFVDFLSGKFTIFLNDRKVIIPYNAVSEQIINSMIRIIRDRYIRKSYQKLHSPYDGEKNNIKEMLYINLLNQLRENSETFDITVIQPSVMLQKNEKGIIRKALKILYGKKLLSSLHLANESEILVISRGKPFKTRTDAIYSHSHIYIPIEKLQSIILEKDDYFDNLQRLYMKTNKHTFMFYFDESNKESTDYYRNLGSILNT